MFVKVTKLAGFRHGLLFHEEGRLDGRVSALAEKRDSVINESQVQECSYSGEEIASVAGEALSPSRLVPSDHVQNLVVMAEARSTVDFNEFRVPPLPDYLIVLFIGKVRHGLMHKVA